MAIHSHKAVHNVPEHIQAFISKVKIDMDEDTQPSEIFDKLPSLTANLSGPLAKEIQETDFRTSVLIPVDNSPYIIEVSVTQQWDGLKWYSAPKRIWFSVEMYGRSWDESINIKRPSGGKKDWGEELIHLFPDSSRSLRERVEEFVESIMLVQYVLDTEMEQ